MGICSGVGYLGVAGYKVWTFGWDDVPPFWIWSGAGLIVSMVAVAIVHRHRDRRELRAAIERSARRVEARGRPAGSTITHADGSSVHD